MGIECWNEMWSQLQYFAALMYIRDALTFYSVMVTKSTTCFSIKSQLSFAQNVFMTFISLSEHKAITSLKSLCQLVCVRKTRCAFCDVGIEHRNITFMDFRL
jgi:hypothetical protein